VSPAKSKVIPEAAKLVGGECDQAGASVGCRARLAVTTARKAWASMARVVQQRSCRRAGRWVLVVVEVATRPRTTPRGHLTAEGQSELFHCGAQSIVGDTACIGHLTAFAVAGPRANRRANGQLIVTVARRSILSDRGMRDKLKEVRSELDNFARTSSHRPGAP